MAKDNRISLPSGIGGLFRPGEGKSLFTFSPGIVIVLCILVAVVVMLLHQFGSALF